MTTRGTVTPAAISATLVSFLGSGDGVPVELKLTLVDVLGDFQKRGLIRVVVGRLILYQIPRVCSLVIRGHRRNAE